MAYPGRHRGWAYYNEIDPFAAGWLRGLIGAGLLPEGEVDGRSVLEVEPGELRPFRQCHFFAGIGGWAWALKLAGYGDLECWTGSCPCQPLSVAGQRRGHADERHLWPAFHRLIAERGPSVVFGEQVAGKDGCEWLAGVRADLEATGYACGAAIMPACAVGAPHRRERLFWVAQSGEAGQRDYGREAGDEGGLALDAGRAGLRPGDGAALRGGTGAGSAGLMADADDGRQQQCDADERRISVADATGANFWDDAVWLVGADGKARRVKPGVRLLAHGVPNRVGRLRGYGNAIVPQVAAEFVSAFMEI